MGSKVPFWQFFNSGKTALLKPYMNMKKKKLAKDFFSSIMKMKFVKNINNIPQGPPNPGFRPVRVEN
jgi:hypothetical protein